MVAGFAISMLLGVAIMQGRGLPLFEVAMAGATVGAGIGLVIGFTLWVLFPFQPGAAPDEPTGEEHARTSRDQERPEENASH
jgi:hypothetical protein